MNNALWNTLAGLALVALGMQALAGAAPQAPLRDPFERPAAPAPTAPPPAAAAPAAAEAPAWTPQLRAVMYQRGHSLVNVSGAVLAVGESVHGYRLVAVGERSVVMVKGGASINLTLDKEPSP